MIATRTRDALARAKARGVKLGGPRQAAVAAISADADRHAANVLPIIREIQRAGATSLSGPCGSAKCAWDRHSARRSLAGDDGE